MSFLVKTTLRRQSACLVAVARLDWSYILADCLALGREGRQDWALLPPACLGAGGRVRARSDARGR